MAHNQSLDFGDGALDWAIWLVNLIQYCGPGLGLFDKPIQF